jgi:hypothetical protein
MRLRGLPSLTNLGLPESETQATTPLRPHILTLAKVFIFLFIDMIIAVVVDWQVVV